MLPLPFQELTLTGKILFVSKYVGTLGVAIGVLYGGVRWLMAVFKRVSSVSDNVQLVLDNHLPHLQASLDSHGLALTGIRSDLRDMSTRLEGQNEKICATSESLDDLHSKFVQHLENAVKEVSPRKRKR